MKSNLLFFTLFIISVTSCTTSAKHFSSSELQEHTRIVTTADSLLTPSELEIKRIYENDYFDLFYQHVSYDTKYRMVFDGQLEDFVSRGLDQRWYNLAKESVKMNNKNTLKMFKNDEFQLQAIVEQFEKQKREYMIAEDKSVLFTAIH